jgi:hypothetical protein
MTTPASNQNEPSKMKKFMSANVDESVRSKLPRNGASDPRPPVAPPPNPDSVSPEPKPARRRLQLLPAFWTIASLMSITVNIILIVILLIMFQMLRAIQTTTIDQASGLLGGLYTNFVKMDQATISTTIPVDATIPLNIVVPVQTTTRVTLAESVTIPNAHVRISTGGLNIDAAAVVTLPANTELPIILDFPLTVQNEVPVHLDVAVNIPLNQTELHEPFVGLQKVVEPWYCMIEPDATVNGLQVCVPDPTLIDPALRTPIPAETVIP